MVKGKAWLGVLLMLLLAGCAARSTAREERADPLPWPEGSQTLYVSADLHWQDSSDLHPSQIPWLEEILRTLLDQVERDRPEALVLCGDLTNSGRLEEHQTLAALLEETRAAGVNIFVTMGNHDLDRDLPPETLEERYGAFGWNQAIRRDEGTMSYLVPLTDELWLLSLDCNVYGDRDSTMAGVIEEETLAWVEECLELAKEKGAMVVPFSHHNLLIHNLNGDGRSYNIEGGEELRDLLLSFGVPLYLSGHRHNSFLAEAETEAGKLTEVVTGLPSSFPQTYGSLTFQGDGTVDYALKSLDVSAWAKSEGRTEPQLLAFSAWTEEENRKRLAEIAARVVEGMEVPRDQGEEMEGFFLDFYTCYQGHGLWREASRLLADPGLSLWKAHAKENIYARWMPWILENQTNDAPEQILGPFR